MQTGYIAPTTTTGTAAGGTSSATGSSQTLGQDAFLQLLVTELQNQDPTSAQDPNTMITQMAQFSGLEQQTDTNTLLTSMQGQVSALFQAQSSSLIGTNVQVTNNSLNLSGGTASIGIDMPSTAANVSLAIQNAAGQTVATLKPGAMAAGNQVVNWNGQSASGTQLPDGTYTVTIAAVDSNGNALAATTTSMATVTAVNFSNGTIMVTAGGQQYPLSSINEISS
jgi:flagellar basal-body rod modification protein FlgD